MARKRRCNRCKQEGELDEFSKDKSKTLGLAYECKRCMGNQKIERRRRKYAEIERQCGKLVEGSRGKITVTHKQCSRCKEWLKHTDFAVNTSCFHDLNSACLTCQSDSYLRANYGITLKEYNKLLKSQKAGVRFVTLPTQDTSTDLFVWITTTKPEK